MKYFLLAALLFLPLQSISGLSQNKTYAIYNKLIHANSLSHPPILVISDDSEINASSNVVIGVITINTGMLRFAQNDDEIARVLGHELGHYYLKHYGSSIPHEYSADYMAMIYMTKAGYDKCIGARLLSRRNSKGGDDHPSDHDRWLRFHCTK